MGDSGSDKTKRVLDIYTRLSNGYVVNKKEEAQRYGVDERTIQRDIDTIRDFLDMDVENAGCINSVDYDRSANGYRLERLYRQKLTNSEILALCKILLDSRAFVKEEMLGILDRLVTCCVPKSNEKMVRELINNEAFHYVELQHKTRFLDTMWDIGQAIKECRYLEIDYSRMKDRAVVTRKIKPLAIMFSEYYFYLTAFIDDEEVRKDFDVIDDAFPTIYRIDRIKKMKVLEERFNIPYRDRFQEGEFRKKVQFMYGGKLQKVKFKYSGENIEAVLDRLPTATVLKEKDGVYTVSAEVFGKGIDMWFRSQGENVEVISVNVLDIL